jgi:hypothetical protein
MTKIGRCLVCALAIATAPAVKATASPLVYSYSYTGNGIAGAGILTTTDVLIGGAYTVTGIQGLRDGTATTGLYAPGAFLGNDNLLFSSGSSFDYAGLSYAAGGVGYNLYNNSTCGTNQDYELPSGSGCGAGDPITLTVAPLNPVSGLLYFAYTYTGSGIAGAGILTTTDTLVSGAFTAVDIQGLRNGVHTTGLDSPGTFLGNDNQLFPTEPFLDYSGISYSVGGLGFNLYNNSTCGTDQDYELPSGSGCGAGDPIDFNIIPLQVQAVPEPATLTLLGLGLTASRVATSRRRRVVRSERRVAVGMHTAVR